MTEPRQQLAPATAHRLRRVLATAQSSGRIPSVVAGVVRDGELVWSGRVGGEVGLAAQPSPAIAVPYRIGSITKTLTAILVLQLERDGALSLDQPASTWLGDVGYADGSLRELLAHVSGMPSEPQGSWWERSPGVSWERLASANPAMARPFAAGERFHYSNLGFALLGRVCEVVLDMRWWDAVQTRILDPLGLGDTTYAPGQGAAQGYSVDPWAGSLIAEPHADTGAMAPAGQAWSTIEDLARYANFLIHGDDQVLSRTLLQRAFTPTAGTPESGLGEGHALGFQLRSGSGDWLAGHTLVGHTGSMPGFLAACLVDPQLRTGAVLLANGTWGLSPGALAVDLIATLEECEPALPEPWVPSVTVPAELFGVLGTWHWGSAPYTFTWEGKQLVARLSGEVASRFAIHAGKVIGVSGYHDGEELVIHRDTQGSVSHLEVATFIHTRVPYDPHVEIPGGHP